MAHDITAHGAVGDGATPATAAIRAAVETAAAAGGGTVRVPAGRFLTGTVVLRSGVRLHLDPGAVLLGSTAIDDYPRMVPRLESYCCLTFSPRALIYAENCENVAITGHGVIDGQGAAFRAPFEHLCGEDGSHPEKHRSHAVLRELGYYDRRPLLIRMSECRRVLIEDVELRDSGLWLQHYLGCEDLVVRGISTINCRSWNNDGIDIDSCRRVRVSGCSFVADDDAICLKATADRPCEDVVVTGCTAASNCNALKLGTESTGGFRNILFSDCVVSPTRIEPVNGEPGGHSGIDIIMTDGGDLENVSFDHIVIDGAWTPVQIRLDDRGRGLRLGEPKRPVGRLRGVRITNLLARGGHTHCSSVTGIPARAVEDVTLAGWQIEAAARRERFAGAVPEAVGRYPQPNMFGPLPASGLYCRHVRGLAVHDLRLRLDRPDPHPAIVCDDVAGLRTAGLDLPAPAGGGEALVHLGTEAAVPSV